MITIEFVPPLVSDTRQQFDIKCLAFVLSMNPWAQQANALAVSVNAKEALASSAALRAEAAASAAVQGSNVPVWVANTQYTQGQGLVYDPVTFLSYRPKTTHQSAVRPDLDVINWRLITGQGDVTQAQLDLKAGIAGQEFTGVVIATDTLGVNAFNALGNTHFVHRDHAGNVRHVEVANHNDSGINGLASGRGHVTRNMNNADGSYAFWYEHTNGDGIKYYGKGQPRWGDNLGRSNATSIASANIADVPMVSGTYILNASGVTGNNQVTGAPSAMVAAGFADIVLMDRQCMSSRSVDLAQRLSVSNHNAPVSVGGVWRRIREFNGANNTWTETAWERIDNTVSKDGAVMSGDLEITDGSNSVYIGGISGFIEICRTDGVGGFDIKSNRTADYDVRLQKDPTHGLNIFTGGNNNTQHKLRIGGLGQAALTLYRHDAVAEGAQADYARALDNATAWSTDVHGSGAVTNFRVIDSFSGQAVLELLGSTGRVYTKFGINFQDGSTQDSAGLGFGQSWQNVTGSRASGVTYTNTTGRPLGIKILSTVTVSSNINGLSVAAAETPLEWVIPVGHTYSFTFSSITAWFELRA